MIEFTMEIMACKISSTTLKQSALLSLTCTHIYIYILDNATVRHQNICDQNFDLRNESLIKRKKKAIKHSDFT